MAPQAPQLSVSWSRSTQPPAQQLPATPVARRQTAGLNAAASAHGSVTVHEPAKQAPASPQMMPQPPQFSGSESPGWHAPWQQNPRDPLLEHAKPSSFAEHAGSTQPTLSTHAVSGPLQDVPWQLTP